MYWHSSTGVFQGVSSSHLKTTEKAFIDLSSEVSRLQVKGKDAMAVQLTTEALAAFVPG